jgi:hypothetical protein
MTMNGIRFALNWGFSALRDRTGRTHVSKLHLVMTTIFVLTAGAQTAQGPSEPTDHEKVLLSQKADVLSELQQEQKRLVDDLNRRGQAAIEDYKSTLAQVQKAHNAEGCDWNPRAMKWLLPARHQRRVNKPHTTEKTTT